jgi:hypothetical protein
MLGRSADAETLAVRTSETKRGTQTTDVLGRVRTAIPPIYDQMEDKGCALPVGAVLPDGTEFLLPLSA